MKELTIITLAISLSFPLNGIAENQTKDLLSFSQNKFLLQQGQFKAFEQSLQEVIRKAVTNKCVESILSDEKLMHLVTAAELIRITGAEHMDALFAKNKKYARFLSAFLQDPEWMQLYLRAGLVPTDTEVGLRVLGDIWNADGQSKDFRQYLPLATGIASSWGAGRNHTRLQLSEHHPAKGKKTNPVWRYNFFKTSYKNNKLHPNFMKLQPWEIRFIVAHAIDDVSFQYCQDNIYIPWNQYTGACWFANYKGGSDFGDSIHNGLLFYAPCSSEIGAAQKTVEQGGVCGALSTMAVIACAARGIPAYAVGQPGHCAYGFRLERGKWQGGFGGPLGGMKEYIFFEGNDPISRELMEAVFADDNNVVQSYREASLARVLTAMGEDKFAHIAWEKAIKTAPLNAFFRQDFQQFVQDRNLFTQQQWFDYARSLLKSFKGHGFAAMEILKSVEPQFLAEQNTQAKLDYFADVHKILATTPMAWSIDPTWIFDAEANFLNDPVANGKLFSLALKEYFYTGDGALFGSMLNWGVKNLVEQGMSEIFNYAFKEAVTAGPGTGESTVQGETHKTDEKALGNAYGQAIAGAEKARSKEAFLMLNKYAAPFRKQESGPSSKQLDCPPGTLASKGGFTIPSSSNRRRDRPCEHANVLTEEAGFFCTNEEDNPHIVIELPASIKMSGVLIVKARNNQEVMKNIKVSRSTDGATWFEVAATNDMPYQWKIETPDAPDTRWIKVESTNPDKTYLMLRNILVFKKNA